MKMHSETWTDFGSISKGAPISRKSLLCAARSLHFFRSQIFSRETTVRIRKQSTLYHLICKSLHFLQLRTALEQQQVHADLLKGADSIADL